MCSWMPEHRLSAAVNGFQAGLTVTLDLRNLPPARTSSRRRMKAIKRRIIIRLPGKDFECCLKATDTYVRSLLGLPP